MLPTGTTREPEGFIIIIFSVMHIHYIANTTEVSIVQLRFRYLALSNALKIKLVLRYLLSVFAARSA